MDRRRRLTYAVAVVAATLCAVLVHDGKCRAAAARPMRRHATTASSEAALDVAAPPEGATWEGGDEALRAGKWLPLPVASALAGGLRFPAAGASMPWAAAAGARPALAGPELPLVPPYVGATRQEQLTLWASLFNPFQVRPRLPAADAETSVPADPRIPAVAGRASERATVDDPSGGVQVGEPKWGVFLGNNIGN